MPFKSNAQRRFLFAKEPAVAADFQSKTPPGAQLPEKTKPSEGIREKAMKRIIGGK